MKKIVFVKLRLLNVLSSNPKISIFIGISLTIAISILRYFTGPEFALTMFYTFPIVLVTWTNGLALGILMAVISVISWLAADLFMLDKFSHPFIPWLNESFRLVVFIFICYILDRTKKILLYQKKLALTDDLTQINNRRAFINAMNQELNRAQRFKKTWAIVYFDIDNFKNINDQYGHQAGDKLLVFVAKTLKENTRLSDVIARLGGDEFAMLLPEASSQSTRDVVAKINKILSIAVKEKNWPVSFSFGVVTILHNPTDIDDLLKQADELLYQVKKSGKNNTAYREI